MFEICNDKTYFLAETTAKNKTIEITLVKDGHGGLLNEHEIKLDLCRAILDLQRGGYIVTKVRALDYDIENVVDVFHLPEFEEARENPMPDIVSGVITSNFDSGASFHLPCKVNKKTREVFAVEVPAQPCGDDSFRNATVNVDGVDRSLLNLTDIVSEYDSDDYDGVLDALYHVQAKNDYWENDGESLTDLIKNYKNVHLGLDVNGEIDSVKYPVDGIFNMDAMYDGYLDTWNITPRSEEERIEEFLEENDALLKNQDKIPFKYISDIHYGKKTVWKNPDFEN